MPSLLDQIERVPPGSLGLFPGNARLGDIRAIAASLAEHGQVTPLIVQRSTGYVIGGNNTLQAALSLGWTEIDIVRVDVDDKRASKINVALNSTADKATWDDDLLLAQLAGLDDLDGTGYTGDDLDELRQVTGALGADASAFLDPFISPPAPPPVPPGPQPPPGPGDSSAGPGDSGRQDEAGSSGAQPPGPPPGTPPAPSPPPGPQAPEWVQLAWTVPPASREVIRRAVTLAQQRNALGTAAEGLHAMSVHYLSTTEQQGPPSA